MLFAAWAAPAMAREAETRRPNVLVLVSDDQRPDSIAALGNPHIRTPNLDSLARHGMVMRRAVCANPICTPSRAEILTGCSSYRNGVLDFGGAIDSQLTPWPRAMREGGYQTWYVGKWHNNGRPALHGYEDVAGLFSSGGSKWWTPQRDWRGNEVTGYRGWIFQSADGREKYPDRGVGLRADISRDFADAAIQILEQRDRDRPFFIHVNFTAPHDPLLIPEGEKYRYQAESLPLPPNYLPEHPFDHGNLRGRDELLLPWPRTELLVRQ
ncbi:MAG: sulfatase-like hydrolase/transferase, partial [Planctomycetales bacterium]|nr:sulfatase-like hydrolase/transferase [Planctomycetales bacterium]